MLKSRRLPKDQETGLVLKYRGGDEAAGVALLRAYEGFIYLKTRKLFGYGVDEDDLLQEARMGFLRALQTYEVDGDVRLTTHAGYWVWSHAVRYLQDHRDDVHVPSNVQWLAFQAIRDEKDISHSDLLQKARAVMSATFCLDVTKIKGFDFEGESVGARIFASDLPGPEELYVAVENAVSAKATIARALRCLTSRERDVIRRRMLTDEPASLEQIGKTYNVCKERIRQIEVKAMSKLRHHVLSLTEGL